MSNAESGGQGIKSLMSGRRVSVSVSPEQLVKTGPLPGGGGLPLVVEPAGARLDLASWARGCRAFIESKLCEHGGLLFRGFDVSSVTQFEEFVAAVSDDLLEYRERSSPRSQVSGAVYTSTDYPANQSIFLHNENSYQRRFNGKIFFYCDTPPREGGETPIADCRRVLARISAPVRARFAEKGWMYVRNYGDGFGLPWRTVFQTEDPAAVEEHCRSRRIEFEWKEGDRLRTRAVLSAISRHPRTGEPTWFNHATFFHVTTLDPWIRDALLAEFGDEAELPTNTYYGDGSSIEPEVLEELRAAYRAETVVFPWLRGDIMVLDNLLAAHGRTPYTGERRILVAMSDPLDREALKGGD
jgi:alpha-ketoglutarate-dependent taurine dioxygenase